MFKNFVTTALRNLRKNKTYSFLNIFGLAMGIACAGLIFLWVEDEMNYDSQYVKKDRLYWVRTNFNFSGVTRTFVGTPGPLAPAMKKEIPGVANACRVSFDEKALFGFGDKSVYETGLYADSSFFSMFGFPFVQGSPREAFRDIHSVVITEKTAGHFFSDAKNCIGKTLRVDNKQDFVVTGVIRDIPKNSSLQFDWVSPMDILVNEHEYLKYWGANGTHTYVELSASAGVPTVNKLMVDFIQKKDPQAEMRPFLFSMNDWHLRDEFENGKQTMGGRITDVRLFTVIAWIILLIACINFMNLATARSEKRAREVGVRKVLGAGKKILIAQFIGEAYLLSLMAVIAGLLLIVSVLPAFNLLVEKQLSPGLTKPLHIIALLAIALVCGLVAGSYPAFYLSSFNPVFVFKGIRSKSGGAALTRRGLVVLQFTVSIVLIISTIIIYQQVQHIKGRDLGYSKEHLVDMEVHGNMIKDFPAIRQDLLNTGLVENAALCNDESMWTSDNTTGYDWAGKDPKKQILISFRLISPEYISTMGMRIVEGRDFKADPAADSSYVLITESLARLMGKGSAVGKIIKDGKQSLQVAGVVKDYVYGDMYGKPDPVIFFNSPASGNYLYVRSKASARPEEFLVQLGAVMKKNNPAYPFVYTFIDEQFNQQFKSETLVGKLSCAFAALAIFISCLGLFGLATYMAERRTKEISIRKVLGASVTGITGLLAGDFLQLVVLSALIAFPLAWWAMHIWLQGYAYRTTIHWWVFLAAGVMALLIALVTIGFQSMKAALTNPVRSLSTE